MAVADLVLPVFAVIVTGWLAGYFGYVSRGLSDVLFHFCAGSRSGGSLD